MAKRKAPRKHKVHDVADYRDPRGRKSNYRAAFCEKALALAQNGAIDFEIAQALECHPATLYRWMTEHPELRDAIQLGKEYPDDRVVRSLYARAVGYNYHSVKILQDKGTPVVVRYIEHVPPDPQAAFKWLINRRPKEWRNNVTVSGDEDKPPVRHEIVGMPGRAA